MNCLGISHVIRESKISDELRVTLLRHPFFHNNYKFELQDTFIEEQPVSEFDTAVLQFLKDENFDHSERIVEYWFQGGNTGLTPHCDYNFIYRRKMQLEGNDWPHKVDKNLIVSPITIAVYLEVTGDMVGGELCISSRTWYEEKEPTTVNAKYIQQFPYESIEPKQGKALYFKGSEHYHWVNKVTMGSRKSMLINFWPKELLDK